MALFVLWNNERFFLDPRRSRGRYRPDPMAAHTAWPGGHACPGPRGPSVLDRLRRRYLHLHRRIGKFYIGATFITAPVAIWMAFINSPWFLVPFTIVQATTWMVFTCFAYICIRRGAIESHSEWMTRSYAIVLIFLEGRVPHGDPGACPTRHGCGGPGELGVSRHHAGRGGILPAMAGGLFQAPQLWPRAGRDKVSDPHAHISQSAE